MRKKSGGGIFTHLRGVLVWYNGNGKKKNCKTPSSPYDVWIVGGHEPPNIKRVVPEVGFSR